jgi:hypothetical protein
MRAVEPSGALARPRRRRAAVFPGPSVAQCPRRAAATIRVVQVPDLGRFIGSASPAAPPRAPCVGVEPSGAARRSGGSPWEGRHSPGGLCRRPRFSPVWRVAVGGRHSPCGLCRRPRFCWLGVCELPVPPARGAHNPPNNALPENIGGLCVPGTQNPPHVASTEHIGGLCPRHGRRPDATEGAVGRRPARGATLATRRAPLAPPRVRGPAPVGAPLRRSRGTGAGGAVGAT